MKVARFTGQRKPGVRICELTAPHIPRNRMAYLKEIRDTLKNMLSLRTAVIWNVLQNDLLLDTATCIVNNIEHIPNQQEGLSELLKLLQDISDYLISCSQTTYFKQLLAAVQFNKPFQDLCGRLADCSKRLCHQPAQQTVNSIRTNAHQATQGDFARFPQLVISTTTEHFKEMSGFFRERMTTAIRLRVTEIDPSRNSPPSGDAAWLFAVDDWKPLGSGSYGKVSCLHMPCAHLSLFFSVSHFKTCKTFAKKKKTADLTLNRCSLACMEVHL